jgi:acetyl esterase/lipase
MKVLGWIGLAVLLLLASLNFNTTQNLTLWKLSIAVTEYGHYLAVLCLLLALWCFRRLKFAIPLVLLAVLFLLPVYQLHHNFAKWENELTGTFGDLSLDPTQKLPDYRRLFIGHIPEPKPETYVFDETHGKLSLDYFRPKRKHAPLIVVIHGGGWNSGERTQFADTSQYFADLGYAVASVDYRLAPEAHWPAQKNDVMAAIAYLRSHAEALSLDPNRWVILGRSAGGQIAERVAYNSPQLEGLKGCIAFYSPELLREYMGGDPKQVRENYDDASGFLFAGAHSVPTLLFHGPRDPLVWVKQSERLFARLQLAGSTSMYVKIPWATHGFDFNLNGPGGQIATFATARFLGKVFQE